MSEEWIDFPQMKNFPDKMMYVGDALLVRYDDENIVIRIENVSKSSFEELQSKIENCSYDTTNKNKVRIRMLISRWMTQHQTSQRGSRVNVPNNIPKQFKSYCNECNTEQTFQIKGMYSGTHATCMICSNRLSIIIDDCDICDEKTIFMTSDNIYADDWYTCYQCDSDLK